jgi:hypothetical protein
LKSHSIYRCDRDTRVKETDETIRSVPRLTCAAFSRTVETSGINTHLFTDRQPTCVSRNPASRNPAL